VRLIGVGGEQIGIVPLTVANSLAEEAEVDLVEIAPTAIPPVCRLMDYGKFRYQESKKKHEAKLKQKQIQIKEVKFRPNTDEGDYNIKLRNLISFLEEGDKAKITLRFRGREMAHQEFGVRLRNGSQLVIPGAQHELLMEQDRFRGQFWAAFDAFVPGTPIF